jgi:uncharacterized alpha-E superfamily protein
MLSRIADSLFWTARYMDRAENAARLLDVTHLMLLEEAQQRYPLRWDAVIRIAGSPELFSSLYDEATPETIRDFLLFSEDHQNSVLSCVQRVRENARTIRDRISREMWEHINSLYHRTRDVCSTARTDEEIHRVCRDTITASHTFNGITDGTLPHDEGWHFIQAGRALERATHTARVVDVEYHKLVDSRAQDTHADFYQWRAVLRSVAAGEIYGRAYHSWIEPEKVAELLILNKHHPRSVRLNISWLQASLRAVSGAAPHSYLNEAERLTGKLHDALVYDRIEDIFARGLHPFLEDISSSCRRIGQEISRSYFHYAGVA